MSITVYVPEGTPFKILFGVTLLLVNFPCSTSLYLTIFMNHTNAFIQTINFEALFEWPHTRLTIFIIRLSNLTLLPTSLPNSSHGDLWLSLITIYCLSTEASDWFLLDNYWFGNRLPHLSTWEPLSFSPLWMTGFTRDRESPYWVWSCLQPTVGLPLLLVWIFEVDWWLCCY